MKDTLKKNNVNVFGKGTQALIFVHGYGCDQNMWRHVTPYFENDYKIILLDLVGMGKSDISAFVPKKYETLQGYADDINEVAAALSLKDGVLIGHSVSAIIGMLAVIAEPGYYSKLVMVAPSPCYLNDGDYQGGFNREDIEEMLEVLDSNYLGWANNMAPAIMGNPGRPELGEELTNSFCRTDPDISKHFARTTFLSDHRRDLPHVKIPTLILQCSNDIIAPDQIGPYIQSQISGSQLRVMKAQGHCPNLSAPDETAQLIKEFLRERDSF